MKKFAFAAAVFAALFSVSAFAADYQYMSAEETADLIRNNKPVKVLDIQERAPFSEQRLKGSVATYAYPAKTDAERGRIEKAIAELGKDEPIVVVCPGGGGGATRTVDHLIANGVDAKRIYILTKGRNGWPTEKIKDVLEGSQVK